MSEPDTEYETDAGPTAGPTPGPWKASIIEKQGAFVDGSELEIASMSVPGKEGIANARLIAAAGTAAQEAREMGYDPVAAVEALPKQINTLEHILRGLAELLTSDEKIPDSALEDLRRRAQRALASAEGSDHD